MVTRKNKLFDWDMPRIRRLLAAIILGIFLGAVTRTVHDVYFDYHSAKGLISASGRPLGGDFVCFYLAGQAAAEDPGELYDWEYAVNRQRALLKAPDGKEWILPYAYPPPFALLLIPFGKLAFLPASLAWIGFSLCISFFAVFLVLSQSSFHRRQRIYASLSLLAFTPFTLDCLAGGQTSAIGMLIFAGIYYLAKKGRWFAAGLVLGLGYYKPPLFIFLAVAFLFQRRWRLISGALVSGLALVLLSIVYLGPSGFIDYLEKMPRYIYGRELLPGLFLPPAKAVGLLPFLLSNLSPKAATAWSLYFTFFAIALLFYIKAWSRMDLINQENRFHDIHYSLGVTLSLLFSVQMCTYDISILFIAIVLVAHPIIHLQNKLPALIGLSLILLSFLTPLLNQIEFARLVMKPMMLLMIAWIFYLFFFLRFNLFRVFR